jgi:hypothetical protein
MSRTLFRPLLLASVLAFAGAAQAAVMTAPVDAAGNFTVTDTTVPPPGSPDAYYTFNIAPSTNPTGTVPDPRPAIYYDENVPNQSVNDIRINVAAAYSVDAATLSTASTCDNLSGPCTGATATSNQLTLTNVSPFDYLAVHFGSNELFFHWATPITSAVLTAISPDAFVAGLSNYRSYLTTPLPGALALFLGALGFLGLRRKLVQPAGAEPMAA